MKTRTIPPAQRSAIHAAAALLCLFLPLGTAAAALPDFLAGYDAGLYRVEAGGERAIPLWLDGEVRKIVRVEARGAEAQAWLLLTSKGIVWSRDLGVFEDRSRGLPVKTYKRFVEGRKSFLTEVQDLKDLELDPADPNRVLTCTKDAVYLSRDGCLSWESLGTPVGTTGLKAVSFGPLPGSGEAAVWASHPIKGLFVRALAANASWAPASAGLAPILGTTSVEEIADMVPAPAPGGAAPGGSAPAGLWASNSFLPRIYRWNPAAKSFATAWAESGDFACIESLGLLPDGSLRFVTDAAVRRLDPATGAAGPDAGAMAVARAALRAKPDWQLLSLSWAEGGRAQSLCELWLLSFKDRKPWRARAENRQGLYLMTGFVVNSAPREKYGKIMDERRLDTVVVDMKDDFGRLRFDPRDPLLRKIGKVSSPLDVEAFTAQWKAKGRYLVARIPVFKDQVAFEHSGGKYAVWDEAAKAPWRGYNTVTKAAPPAPAPGGTGPGLAAMPPTAAPETSREQIKEYWVDPYCEEVWAYNVAIAREIVERGFDEVQFDYIRFPTDGANIDGATFRWREGGMDKESALASFLRFARENIAAPISIDIYGANGWYRSGVRTGQDVELLAKYVDVICPMLYPSHFEQGFLAQAPAEERPYRIYRIGSLRNAYIARKRVVVRPFIQAFFLNVSYDRAFYNLDYVKREVAGVRDAVNLGMTFWNNAGRYDDIPVLELGPDGKLAPGAAAAAPRSGILD